MKSKHFQAIVFRFLNGLDVVLLGLLICDEAVWVFLIIQLCIDVSVCAISSLAIWWYLIKVAG